jgi:hypothetical protein
MKVSKAIMIRGLVEAPHSAHLERVRDKGAAESAEVGVGHVVGHGQHAHTRLPACLELNGAHKQRQPWTSGHEYMETSNPEILEGGSPGGLRRRRRRAGRGGGGRRRGSLRCGGYPRRSELNGANKRRR